MGSHVERVSPRVYGVSIGWVGLWRNKKRAGVGLVVGEPAEARDNSDIPRNGQDDDRGVVSHDVMSLCA
jgi:hypothetical protein